MRWLAVITIALNSCVYEAPLLLRRSSDGDDPGGSHSDSVVPSDAGDEAGDGPVGDPFAAGDPHAGDFGDPGWGDPTSGDPGDPASGDPWGDPTSGDPASGDPWGDSTSGDPASGDPWGDPYLGDPSGDFGDAWGDPTSGDPGGTTTDALTMDEPDVRINEIYTHSDDWLELYNAGTGTGLLHNWTLTDDNSNTFTFGSGITIAPGQHLLICEQGVSTTFCIGTPRFNFGLNKDGDEVTLTDADEAIVDWHSWPQDWGSNNSEGRRPDGTGGWVLMTPTPGTTNL